MSCGIAARLFLYQKGGHIIVYTEKALIMDETGIDRALMRISHEIIESIGNEKEIVLFGICRRGMPIAKIIADNIARFSDIKVCLDEIDITLFRDDRETEVDDAVKAQKIAIDITGKTVVLVDDVLFTGRTIRAAMDALMEVGRPACIRLAVLIDRGHRELPIRADFVGKNVPTSRKEKIAVRFPEFDGKKEVAVIEKKGAEA